MNRNRLLPTGCTIVTVLSICAICLSILGALILLENDATNPPPRQIHLSGQDVIVGNIRWKLLEANDLGNALPPPSDFQPGLTSSGRFIWIRFEIENRGTDETASYLGVELTDETGRKFVTRSDTASWLDEELCSLKRFNPGVATVCGEIFEVPGGVRGLKLIATDFAIFGSEEALIELGVN